MKPRIETVIFEVLDEINLQLPKGEKIEKTPAVVIFGNNAVLDSLGFINFIVLLEQYIENEFKRSVSLIGENTLMQESMPFSTIGSLTDYLSDLLD